MWPVGGAGRGAVGKYQPESAERINHFKLIPELENPYLQAGGFKH